MERLEVSKESEKDFRPRDMSDAKPIGLTKQVIRSGTCDSDPTGDCAESCSDCASDSAASCGTCQEGRTPSRG